MSIFDCKITGDKKEALFDALSKEFDIYGPVREIRGGRYCDDDVIMYRQLESLDSLEIKEKSTYSPKEMLTPMTETLFYFNEDQYTETSERYKKKVLVFARACDINAIKYLDDMYLKNANVEDPFYKRRKKMISYALMECAGSLDEHCFCVSTQSNKTDDYTIAVRFNDDGSINLKLNDGQYEELFADFEKEAFDLKFPEENDFTVTFPEIKNDKEANALANDPMWDEYNSRCIACGSCTTACSTCTCFTTRDLVYTANANVGERRRTNASCMTKDFDLVAGGGKFRPEIKDRYRYKILHKIYAHNERFGDGAMCVGCGRCSAHCPQLISYPATIEKVAQALTRIREGEDQ
ncbi:MAG: anaerobic sulfite reductase subunit AsrA [Tissierellia bacterium]|nr:anaerobic sulfite reductase subunit AsrA [Tissierellia bacterium]